MLVRSLSAAATTAGVCADETVAPRQPSRTATTVDARLVIDMVGPLFFLGRRYAWAGCASIHDRLIMPSSNQRTLIPTQGDSYDDGRSLTAPPNRGAAACTRGLRRPGSRG